MRVTLVSCLIVSLVHVACVLGSKADSTRCIPSPELPKLTPAFFYLIFAKAFQDVFSFLHSLLKGPVDVGLLRRGIIEGNVERVRELLFVSESRLRFDDGGAMALFLAITHRQLAVTRFLLDEYGVKADVRLKVGHGHSVPVYNYLIIANSKQDVFGDDKDAVREQIVKAFVAKMPDLGSTLRNKTLVDYDRHEQAVIINSLLATASSKMLSRICMHAKKEWGGVDALYGRDQLTLLHEACLTGNISAVKGILAEGASPLTEAVIPSYIPFSKMIKGASTRSEPWTPIAVAVATANGAIVELLMTHLTETPSFKVHPLDVACELSELENRQAVMRALKVSETLGNLLVKDILRKPQQRFTSLRSWLQCRDSDLFLHRALKTGSMTVVQQALLTRNHEGLDEKSLAFVGNEFGRQQETMVRVFEYIANTGKIRLSGQTPLSDFRHDSFSLLFENLIGSPYRNLSAHLKERLMKALGTMLPVFLPAVIEMSVKRGDDAFFQDALKHWYPVYKANDTNASGLKSVLLKLERGFVEATPQSLWRELGIIKPIIKESRTELIVPSIYD